MKTVFVIAAAILLSACETGDGWVPRETPDAPQAAAPPAPVARVETAPLPPAAKVEMPLAGDAPIAVAPVTPSDVEAAAHCRAVARQRAQDARANGFSLDMEQIIFDGTYKDCLSWNRKQAR